MEKVDMMQVLLSPNKPTLFPPQIPSTLVVGGSVYRVVEKIPYVGYSELVAIFRALKMANKYPLSRYVVHRLSPQSGVVAAYVLDRYFASAVLEGGIVTEDDLMKTYLNIQDDAAVQFINIVSGKRNKE